jgi:hypothetical protein
MLAVLPVPRRSRPATTRGAGEALPVRLPAPRRRARRAPAAAPPRECGRSACRPVQQRGAAVLGHYSVPPNAMLSGARLQARPLQLELGGSRLIRLPRLPRSHQTAAHDHQNRRKWPIEQPTQCARVRCCAADSEDPGQDRPYELRGRKDQIAWQEEEEIIQAEAARTTERQEHTAGTTKYPIVTPLLTSLSHLRDRRSAAWHRPPTVAEAPSSIPNTTTNRLTPAVPRQSAAPCWAATLRARYFALTYATRRFLRRPSSVA